MVLQLTTILRSPSKEPTATVATTSVERLWRSLL